MTTAAAELLAACAAASGRFARDVLGDEALLDAAVRLLHRPDGRAGLTAAAGRAVQERADAPWWRWDFLGLLAAGCGIDPAGRRPAAEPALFEARIAEFGTRLAAGDPAPLPLATPTAGDGTIAAAELAARIRAYERLAAEPGPLDRAQALCRVAPGPPGAADGLGSAAGRALARVLAGGEPARARELAAVPEPLAALLDPAAAVRHTFDVFPTDLENLPFHPELSAARALPGFRHRLADGTRMGCAVLARIAAQPGEVGPAVRTAAAYGLASRHEDDRAAAVDALAALAARGPLDGAAVGRALAEQQPLLKAGRLAGSLAAAAAVLGPEAVWPMHAALLRALLPAEPRGLAELLAAAADCARRTDGAAPPPGLDALADRPARTRLATEARALRAATGG